jgi:hypothetical protein
MPSAINADNGVVSGTAGLKSSADSSGVLDLQTNGTTAISISASQVVTFANQPAYTGGTANGVLYLNASKVVTTGSALTFDGSQLDIPLGSAATPSLSTPTDPNTGMFFPAADTIAFAEGGVEAMRLDSSGRLLVGTTSSIGTATVGRLQVLGGGTYVTTNSEAGGFVGVNSNADNSLALVADVDNLRSGSHIAFYVDGFSEKMRLDSNGNLGLGVTPSAWGGPFDAMQLGTYGQHIAGQTNTADLKIGTNNYYNGSNYVYTVTGYNAMQIQLGQGVFNVSAAPAGTAGATASLTQIIGVAADQSVALQGATSQSGTGITFPATQSASANANTLDDYEQGTFTPTFNNGTFTYTIQQGNYTKIGNLVTVGIGLQWSANTGNGNSISITLPFVATGATGSRYTGSLGYVAGLTFAANSIPEVTISNGSSGINIFAMVSGTTPTNLLNSALGASGEFQVSITYLTN